MNHRAWLLILAVAAGAYAQPPVAESIEIALTCSSQPPTISVVLNNDESRVLRAERKGKRYVVVDDFGTPPIDSLTASLRLGGDRTACVKAESEPRTAGGYTAVFYMKCIGAAPTWRTLYITTDSITDRLRYIRATAADGPGTIGCAEKGIVQGRPLLDVAVARESILFTLGDFYPYPFLITAGVMDGRVIGKDTREVPREALIQDSAEVNGRPLADNMKTIRHRRVPAFKTLSIRSE